MNNSIPIAGDVEIADGFLYRRSEYGSGSIFLAARRNVLVPDYFREATVYQLGKNGFYGFDFDWAIPIVIFRGEYRQWADRTDPETADIRIAFAIKTVRDHFSEVYARYARDVPALAA
jgi:hypothetical protein